MHKKQNVQIKDEWIYLRCSRLKGRATKRGRQQFLDRDSRGIVPAKPDRYYLRLMDGKKWFHWTQAEYRSSYLGPEWVGWYQLRRDFADELELLRAFFRWLPGVLMPDFLQPICATNNPA